MHSSLSAECTGLDYLSSSCGSASGESWLGVWVSVSPSAKWIDKVTLLHSHTAGGLNDPPSSLLPFSASVSSSLCSFPGLLWMVAAEEEGALLTSLPPKSS